MRKLRAYLTGDAHLMASIYSGLQELSKDSYKAFDQMTTLICEDADNNPDKQKVVVLAGDISDKNYINRQGLQSIKNLISEMKNRNIPILSIPGNHDEDHSIAGLDYITNIKNRSVRIAEHTIAGIGYEPTKILLEKLKEYNKKPIDLLVTHTALKHVFSLPDTSSLSLEDLYVLPNIKNFIAGHIHVTDFSKMPNGGYCVSPGSLHPTKSDEIGPRGFVIWDIGDKPVLQQLDLRPCKVFTCKDKDDILKIDLPIADFLSGIQPFVILRYVKTLRPEIERIIKENPTILFKENIITYSDVEDEEAVAEMLANLKENKDNAKFVEVLKQMSEEDMLEDKMFEFLTEALSADADHMEEYLDAKIKEMIDADTQETGIN